MQRLAQALRNVVLNAIKYTPDGGRIAITGQLRDDEVWIAVRDSGIGIDPQYHELIFQKFFRTHDPSLHSSGATKFLGAGPGLGLTIARGVIEAHGGRIWVESDGEDRKTLPGSTFTIALPLHPRRTRGACWPSTRRGRRSSSAAARGPRTRRRGSREQAGDPRGAHLCGV